MYSASKAALLIAGQTWRLELAPLGVRTINLATGAVKTNAFENIVHNTVPEKSYYAGVRDFIHDLGDGRLQAGAMDSKLYASKVVREVERGSSGKLWIGGSASAARWALWLLPQSIIVSVLYFPRMIWVVLMLEIDIAVVCRLLTPISRTGCWRTCFRSPRR